jgi:hypothetical protein
MPRRSITEIPNPQELLDTYCSPNERYAWPLYDEDPSPGTLCGVDLSAPAFLNYPIPGDLLDEMGCAASPCAKLVTMIREFVELRGTTRFPTLNIAAIEALGRRERDAAVNGPEDWQALVRCLDAVQDLDRLTSVAVTKILHRKRPDLVPINDSFVGEFYTCKRSSKTTAPVMGL